MNVSPATTVLTLASCFYISRCRVSSEAVKSIVRASRITNARTGLTGGMLFTGTYFAQIIEGPEPALRRMMRTIDADERHDKLTRLAFAPIDDREYGNWTMGFITAPKADDLINDILHGKSNATQTRVMHYLLKEWIAGGI